MLTLFFSLTCRNTHDSDYKTASLKLSIPGFSTFLNSIKFVIFKTSQIGLKAHTPQYKCVKRYSLIELTKHFNSTEYQISKSEGKKECYNLCKRAENTVERSQIK